MSKGLDAITDKVLAHRPVATPPLKVIAGQPDQPLVIGGIEIPCYVLEDETRVLSQRGFIGSLGMSEGGARNRKDGAPQLAILLRSTTLAPHVNEETLVRASSPILFTPLHGGRTAYGYPATLLTDICEVVLAARAAGDLQRRQLHIAERCEILIRGLARVGIIALIDEATGYQRIREERALATILEKFIDRELQSWTRTFPFTFYEQIFRLKGWGSATGVKRPQVIGHYTNDFVYERIAPGVLEELRKSNPLLPQGWRKNRHHQWFTPEFGNPRLKEHLEGVTALMRAAPNWGYFKRSLDRAYPKTGTQFPMPIDEYNQQERIEYRCNHSREEGLE